MKTHTRPYLSLALALALIFSLFAPLGHMPALAVSPDIVISQVYGGGGNSGGIYTNDFIELLNRGTSAVSLAGWSVQYASATGTGNFGANSGQLTPLPAITLAPGQYFLIQEAAGNSCSGLPCGSPLPTPDVTDATPINMSGTGGKVALVTSATSLGCNGGSTPCSAAQLALIKDLTGWDGANFYETTGVIGTGPAPATTNSTAIFRNNGGCTDNDNNAVDFIATAPVPRNTASALNDCTSPTNPSGAGAASPNSLYPGDSTLLIVAAYPGTNPSSPITSVTCDLTAIGGLATQAFYNDGTNGDATAGDNFFSFATTVAGSTTSGVKSLACAISDDQSRTANATISLTVSPQLVAIHDIQGASHLSPKLGQLVSTQGIVTALRSNGFYIQDPNPDGDLATSEGMFIFTLSAPTAKVADAVLVTGTVKEFRPGGSSSANLTTTELDNPGRSVTVLSSSNPLPDPIVIGTGGRIPPNTVIEDDATGSVETSGVFDPANDGIDFYEAMEGMRVQVNDAVAVGPNNSFGELAVVGDNGANLDPGERTPRGGVVIRPGDFNPERIILDDEILKLSGQTTPPLNVGDHLPGATVGVLDYNFGNFMVEVTQLPTSTSGNLQQEVAPLPASYQLSVAAFNVENLAPANPPSKFSTLADLIVNNLKAPDLISIEEVQDNSGSTNDGVVAADVTWGKLITAIQTAGGPTYQYRQIDPVNNQDGGAPGSNIRQGFLFRTDRGLSFVDHPGGDSTTSTSVTGSGASTELSFSPGRIDPTNAAFTDSRKPLAGEFNFKGDKVFVIANHFNSKSGDNPLFGQFQPPIFSSEVQRLQQAQVVHDFSAQIMAADPTANVVVLGDLNDFQFSNPLITLKGTILNDLIDTLPVNERYSYVFEGNSEVLDHILINATPFARPFVYDVVHVNSEFFNQASDHEPQVLNVCVDGTPPALSVSVSPKTLWPPNHQYITVSASPVASDNADPNPAVSLVSVTSSEPDNGLGDGDLPNDIVIVNQNTFNLRAERSGIGNGRTYTITYQAIDGCGNTTIASSTVTVPHDNGN